VTQRGRWLSEREPPGARLPRFSRLRFHGIIPSIFQTPQLPMVNISDLPGELLSDVADYLEYDRRTLHSLTLVSRRWRPVAEKLLYRHIEPLTRHSNNWSTGQTCYILLHRSFDETPQLRRHVQSCSASAECTNDGQQFLLRGTEDGGNTLTDLKDELIISMYHVQLYMESWRKATHQLDADLLRYPNLKGLHIKGPLRVHPNLPFSLEAANGTSMPTLYPDITQTITSVTWHREPSSRELLVFMQLPNIRTITANHFIDFNINEAAPKSSLRHLVLYTRNGFPVSGFEVERFLRCCPSLEELRWIPYLKALGRFSSDSHSGRLWVATTQPTVNALELVQDTLKVLEIAIEDPTRYMPWHQIGSAKGFPVNFSFLRCLRYLKINAFLLLPFVPMWNSSVQKASGKWKYHLEQKEPHFAGRHRMHELLPSSIKIVHVRYPQRNATSGIC
jgi:hypothetical protein